MSEESSASTAGSTELEVALYWGRSLIDVRHFRAGQALRIGSEPPNDVHLFDARVGPSLELARRDGEAWRITPPLAARVGWARRGEATGMLSVGDEVSIGLEPLRLVLRCVPASAPVVAPPEAKDYRFARLLTLSVMGVAALLVAFFLTDTKAGALSEDLAGGRLPSLQSIFKTQHRDRRPRLPLPKDAVQSKPDPLASRAPEPSAKAGARNRERDLQKVRQAGLLGFLGGPAGATTNLFNSGGIGSVLDEALGALKGPGAAVADSGGLGGMASRGVGPVTGGGGLGLDGLGTLPGGRGGPGADPYAVSLSDGLKRQSAPPPPNPVVTGGCERSTIARVISRRAGQVRYCYEARLGASPSLAGKLTVSFTIDATGAVSEADVSQSTVDDRALEQCVLARVRTWKFPEPKDGGVCVIHYPWVFQVAGSASE